MLGTEDEPLLIDVRQPEEVAAWAIPGVVNLLLVVVALYPLARSLPHL
jgi:rhodanese-related sulfurtransferase